MPVTNQKLSENIKLELKAALTKLKHQPALDKSATRNPIAAFYRQSAQHNLRQDSRDFLETLRDAVKLVITDESYRILQQYYLQRREEKDAIGAYYKTLSFENFILRLYHCRYLAADLSLDHCQLTERPGAPLPEYSKHFPAQFIDHLGTKADHTGLYKSYLTFEEMILASLLMPMMSSVIIGPGVAKPESAWEDLNSDFDNAIDRATIIYPGAFELGLHGSLHPDSIFMIMPAKVNADLLNRMRQQPALMDAAFSIYGEKLAAEDDFDQSKFIPLIPASANQNQQYDQLHIDSYLFRTKQMLKQILLMADHEFLLQQSGRTLNLKVLGFSKLDLFDAKTQGAVANLYYQALLDAIDEIYPLKYIQTIHVVDPNFSDRIMPIKDKPNLKVMQSKFQPLGRVSRTEFDLELGGSVCDGTSSALFGNRGNIGMPLETGDDTATLYSLLEPNNLNPALNKEVSAKKIYVLSAQSGLKPLLSFKQPESKEDPIPKAVGLPSKEAIKSEAYREISAAKDLEALFSLFKAKYSPNHFLHHQPSASKISMFTGINLYKTTRTWSDILDTLQAQFMLLILGANAEENNLNESSSASPNDEKAVPNQNDHSSSGLPRAQFIPNNDTQNLEDIVRLQIAKVFNSSCQEHEYKELIDTQAIHPWLQSKHTNHYSHLQTLLLSESSKQFEKLRKGYIQDCRKLLNNKEHVLARTRSFN